MSLRVVSARSCLPQGGDFRDPREEDQDRAVLSCAEGRCVPSAEKGGWSRWDVTLQLLVKWLVQS